MLNSESMLDELKQLSLIHNMSGFKIELTFILLFKLHGLKCFVFKPRHLLNHQHTYKHR